jgi:hypothetical protein
LGGDEADGEEVREVVAEDFMFRREGEVVAVDELSKASDVKLDAQAAIDVVVRHAKEALRKAALS